MNKFEKTLHFISSKIQKDSPFYGQIFLVGGCVRDELLHERYSDLDLLVNMPDGQKMFVEYMCATYPDICKGPFYYQRYGTTAMDVIIDGNTTLVECVEPHVEAYDTDGVTLLETRFCSLEEDASRRDYTCNALYKNLSSGKVIDPTGLGIEDLKNRFLRTPREPNMTFRQDPVRMLRGIRFKHQKGFALDPIAWDAILKQHEEMRLAAPKRLRDELNKLLKARSFGDGIDDLMKCHLLKYVIPGLEEILCVTDPLPNAKKGITLWEHTRNALNTMLREHPYIDHQMKLAVLMCDIADRYGVTKAAELLRNAQIGKERIASIIHTIQMYQRFRSFYDHGEYIGKNRSLPHFIIGLGHRKDDFRRMVRVLNHGLMDEYKLPYQVFYDNAEMPHRTPLQQQEPKDPNRNHRRNVKRREQRKRKRQAMKNAKIKKEQSTAQ